jgi:hypothetical protein
MAKRNSMSTARQTRNRSPKSAAKPGSTEARRNDADAALEAPRATRSGALLEIVSVERIQLMKADAVLGCVAFALLYEDWLQGPRRPCFADAVAVAQDLITRSVDRLGAG